MQNAPHRGAFSFWFFSGLKSLFDCTLRRHLTDPAWPAGLRGECPPAPAYGGCLLLYFAPKGIPTRAQSVCRRSALFHQGGEASRVGARPRSEEHTSELQSLMRFSTAVFRSKKKKH